MIVLHRTSFSLVAFPFLIACCTVARAEPRCAENVATVVSAQGNVDIRGNATQEWQPVKVDAGICAGDSVTVRRFSRAVLRLEQEQTGNRTKAELGEAEVARLSAGAGADQHTAWRRYYADVARHQRAGIFHC